MLSFGRLQQQLVSFMQFQSVTSEAISQQFDLRPDCFSACVMFLIINCTIMVRHYIADPLIDIVAVLRTGVCCTPVPVLKKTEKSLC